MKMASVIVRLSKPATCVMLQLAAPRINFPSHPVNQFCFQMTDDRGEPRRSAGVLE
jgi:hypothetical protein